MTENQSLLAEYARTGSESAFRELVARYVNLVYSTALRLVNGDTHRAEDVAQVVFLDLSRAAQSLPRDIMLGGWLHRHTCFVAAKQMRGERRRQNRERQAMEIHALRHQTEETLQHVAPLLDDAINKLNEDDRAAILLRFFEQLDFRSVGAALGSNEDAARMRVNRALDKLQGLLKRNGIASSAATLSVVLGAHAVHAAPAALIPTISNAALAGTALTAATITTQTGAMTMNWIHLKSAAAVLAAGLAAGTGTYFVQQDTIRELQAENRSLAAVQQTMAAERDDALAVVEGFTQELNRRDADRADLLRLRNEVGQLRRTAREAEQLAGQYRQLREAFEQLARQARVGSESELNPERQFATERMSQAKDVMLGVIKYARAHDDQLPADLNAISSHLGSNVSELLGAHPLELVAEGSLANVTRPDETIILRSHAPFILGGKRAKVYAFADGHAQLHREPEEGFDAWEQARMIPRRSNP